jgi:ubiquinone/menaquinone biosynthesis C-methylase UbiE
VHSRLLDPELLDAPFHDERALDESLVVVAQVNRWLGGVAPVRRHLKDLGGRSGRILDIGTGNGDTLARLGSGRASDRWSLTGVDLSRQTAVIAKRRNPCVGITVGDAFELPFADGSFDAAVSFLTLHHFDDPGAIRVLAEMSRVAGGRVVVSDLERHRVNYAGAKVLAKTAWRSSPLTAHDGPLSVRKSFRADELARLAESAGLENARVTRHFPFRLVLTSRRSPR